MKIAPFVLLLTLCGCAPRDYFRTQIGQAPCLVEVGRDCRTANLLLDKHQGYALGFVEFDDYGRFYDARQAQVLLNWLEDESQPQYVVVYTHGWHHNASDNDSNVWRFKNSLREIKQRNPNYRVTGVYLGWRGETVKTPWLRTLTFWSRKATSETLGRGQFRDFLLQVEQTLKPNNATENRMLTIGHSLGAMSLYNALQTDWLEHLYQRRNVFGDLLVLVNPAIEARRFAALRAAASQIGQKTASANTKWPSLMIVGSEADGMTKNPFTWSRALPALFEAKPSSFLAPELTEASAWELNATAIGHYQRFITHRLEAAAELSADSGCPAIADSESRQSQSLASMDDTITAWPALPALLLNRRSDAPAEGVWFVQTNKNVLPNHGFMAQKPFWCFIEHGIQQAAKTADFNG